MSDVQIAVIDQQDTQIVLAVPGVQGATGSSIPSGGTTDQVLRKNSSTDYDANWAQVTSAMIANGTIVNDDINNSAAIAGTKISPDFGGQAVTTTGQVSAGRVNVTNNTPPSNGIYLPSANNVAISTNSTGKLFVDASGNVGVNISPSARFHVVDTDSSSAYDANAILGTQTSIYKQIIHTNQSSGTNEAGLVFRAGTSSNIAEWGISTQRTGATSGDLIFRTRTGASTSKEFFRITSTGTVNIVGAGSAGSTQSVSFNGSAPVDSLVLTSGGLLGIGTSAPGAQTESRITGGGAAPATSGTSQPNAAFRVSGTGTTGVLDIGCNGSAPWIQSTDRIDLSQKYSLLLNPNGGSVGIGTTSPAATLHLESSAGTQLRIKAGSTNDAQIDLIPGGQTNPFYIYFNSSRNLIFQDHATERARIDSSGTFTVKGVGTAAFSVNGGAPNNSLIVDSSGRCLVGTSNARTVSEIVGGTVYTNQPNFQLESPNSSLGISLITNRSADATGPFITLGKSRGNALGGIAVVQNGDELGNIYFAGADGTDIQCIGAAIFAEVDGDPGANDMPGRLVFSTTPDDQTPFTGPVERMRIRNNGDIWFNQTSSANPAGDNVVGAAIGINGIGAFSNQGGPGLRVNRKADDGDLAQFYQDGTVEGSISVSGTTVSYNGAHLSRWSQLPSGAERTEILRGSVLSNIDEMCEWGEEDNEQLNRMKVSDVEGDKNVSGVFQAWDDDDDTYTNDFYCAMTGDFIIRIGAGVTVERGDLLMSAGDGTAKPQDDDIIRSKTIAKVTSTNVSCTYDDGSYCVPCVLMAC